MKKTKKVMLVCPYFPPHIGGVQIYAHHISKGLKKNYDWDVVVVTSNHIERKFKVQKLDSIKIYRLPSLFKFSNTPINPLWYFQIRKIIKEEKPDVINAHSTVPFISDIAAIVCGSIPFVLTYHAGKTNINRGLLTDAVTSFYENYLVKFIFSRSNHIIAASDYVVQSYLKNYLQKTSVITPGVDVNRFIPSKTNEAKRLLFVGSLTKAEKYKGLDVLIKALALVLQKHKDIKLAVVGGGDLKPYYQSLCNKYALSKNVNFYGRLNSEDLVKQYQKATLLVHPSAFDNFPLVLLEAMASQLPIVTTKVGSITDIVKHNVNGILVPPRDTDKLAASIIRILQDKSLANSMGMAGYRKVKRKYLWSIQAAATNEVFAKFIS